MNRASKLILLTAILVLATPLAAQSVSVRNYVDRLFGRAQLKNTATPGSYTSANITMDSEHRITALANGSGGGAPTFADVNTALAAADAHIVLGPSAAMRRLGNSSTCYTQYDSINGSIVLVCGNGDLGYLVNFPGWEMLVANTTTYVWTAAEFYSPQGAAVLGKPSIPFPYAILGSASQPTCDATTRGATMPVFAGSGSSDTFQVCMKSAADSYAWKTGFTAP